MNVVNCIGSTVVGGVDKGVVVSINTAGQIIVEASQSPTTSAFVSLDGISFAIDQ
jgi:hypothetical protein